MTNQNLFFVVGIFLHWGEIHWSMSKNQNFLHYTENFSETVFIALNLTEASQIAWTKSATILLTRKLGFRTC